MYPDIYLNFKSGKLSSSAITFLYVIKDSINRDKKKIRKNKSFKKDLFLLAQDK
jgi:hypothetical protein